VTTAAILSDMALEHAESASERDKLAIAAGNFVPPVTAADPAVRHGVQDEAGQQAPAASADSPEDMSAVVNRNLELFAGAFLDAVDPVRAASGIAGVEAEEEEEEGGAKDREELITLCEAFHKNPSLFGPAAGAAGGGAAGAARLGAGGAGGAGGARIFKADDAEFLVARICRYPHGSAGTAERTQWEQDVIVGIKVLKLLAKTWRSSVTEEAPPAWLLEGVPRMLVQLLSMRDCGDRVAVCCLELGIELLHGGNEFFQESLCDIMMEERQGAPDLFAHLQAAHHLSPYTLHLLPTSARTSRTPFSLHPTPHALHATPYSRSLRAPPGNPNPKPYTRHPTPGTRPPGTPAGAAAASRGGGPAVAAHILRAARAEGGAAQADACRQAARCARAGCAGEP